MVKPEGGIRPAYSQYPKVKPPSSSTPTNNLKPNMTGKDPIITGDDLTKIRESF